MRAGVLGMLLLGLATSGGLVSCSGKPVDENDPASLFEEAEENVKNDQYQIAIDKFRNIRNKFPYSKFAVDSQLRIADVYFLQESYAEAALAYETFKDLHPRHEKVAYAMLRLAQSYANEIPSTVARDAQPAQRAQDAYNDFLARFPAAPEAAEAKKGLTDARTFLADKELDVGNYYFKRDDYDSARPRFSKILEMYPESEAAKEAKAKLAVIQTKRAKDQKDTQEKN